jgi:hypothetical protein
MVTLLGGLLLVACILFEVWCRSCTQFTQTERMDGERWHHERPSDGAALVGRPVRLIRRPGPHVTRRAGGHRWRAV